MAGSKKQLAVYQELAIKKNSSSTSELLASGAKSQKHTHRAVQDAGQLKNEKTDRETSNQQKEESKLNSNLINKMQ